MKSSNWKGIAELVGIAAIVASLIFVALQLKQSQDIALSELGASRHASQVELDQSISNHAEIWARGNAGDELNQADAVIYRRLIHSMHWASWTSWRRNLLFNQSIPWKIIIADFASFLYQNPGARKAWMSYIDDRERHRHLLVPEEYERNEFASLVFDDLAKLDQQSN
jgi:hypothetical protein